MVMDYGLHLSMFGIIMWNKRMVAHQLLDNKRQYWLEFEHPEQNLSDVRPVFAHH